MSGFCLITIAKLFLLVIIQRFLSPVDGENGIEYDEEPSPTSTSPTSQGSGRPAVPRTGSGTLPSQNQGKKKVFFKKVGSIFF